MTKKKSQYEGARRVFVFPRLGIVVKTARFYWRISWENLSHKIRKFGLSSAWSFFFSGTEETTGSPRRLLAKGLRDNWEEFWFYWRFRHSVLQPTYFSLFGLVNIQKWGEILDEEEFEQKRIWGQMLDLTNKETRSDGHHFTNPANFCLENQHLRMVDYGSPATRKILRKWADVLYEQVLLKPKDNCK